MNRKPRLLKANPTNSLKVNAPLQNALDAVRDAQTDPAKRDAARRRAEEWERRAVEAWISDEPEPEPESNHEGRHLVTIIDAHDGRPGHLGRDAVLTAIIARLRLYIAAQQVAPRQPGRPTDYAGMLRVALIIAAAGVPFSTTRGSLCEQAVIKHFLSRRRAVEPTDAEDLAAWVHKKLRQLAYIAEAGPNHIPVASASVPGWKPSPGWASGMLEAESERLDELYDRLFPGWREP